MWDKRPSHTSGKVIELWSIIWSIITFECLPADSTKMQLRDVGVFSPMRNAWRGAAAQVPVQGPKSKILQKTEFPAMAEGAARVIGHSEALITTNLYVSSCLPL